MISHPRGRILGGSSAINLGVWTHPSRKDIDDWGELGNEGWSWDEIFPYFLKSETYSPPSAAAAARYGLTQLDPSLHGRDGPVQVSFPTFYNSWQSTWDPTFENLGVTLNGDPKDGRAFGPYENLVSYDPKTATRSFAATAYYAPNAKRPNLKVLTDAHVSRVLFAARKSTEEPLTAVALSFTAHGGNYTVKAKREVILSAGTFQSPQLLELSGIGGKSTLEPLGITVRKENPNVGRNLQDHVMVPLGFQAAAGEVTREALRDPAVQAAVFAQYAQNRTGPLATVGPAALLSLRQIINSLKHQPVAANRIRRHKRHGATDGGRGGREQYELTVRKLFDDGETPVQIFSLDGGVSPQFSASSRQIFAPLDPATNPDQYFTLFGILEYPFSRGTVHITSTDPQTRPAVDPNYFSDPFDRLVASAMALHLQTLARTAPLADKLEGHGTVFQPGYEGLTASNVFDRVKKTFLTSFHPLGTCAMRPEASGGVVDSRLTVYGTTNLRVVDASVFPLAVRSNTQSLVYAVAERAAEWIKEAATGHHN